MTKITDEQTLLPSEYTPKLATQLGGFVNGGEAVGLGRRQAKAGPPGAGKPGATTETARCRSSGPWEQRAMPGRLAQPSQRALLFLDVAADFAVAVGRRVHIDVHAVIQQVIGLLRSQRHRASDG